MDEKRSLMGELPVHVVQDLTTKRESLRRASKVRNVLTTVFFAFLTIGFLIRPHLPWPRHGRKSESPASVCKQVDPILPAHQTDKLVEMDAFLRSSVFRADSIDRLTGAVQVPTQSFDDMGKIGEDPRWDVMYDFAEYLDRTFPLIHERLDIDYVNEHGLVYTWKGSDPELKPTLLMAHQDTVPVPNATVDAWTHPPFDGFYDGKFIWGRGSSDCKNQLIAIMEAVELLLDADFVPTRTVILSFGFDEEISGREGAGHLAPYLLKKYGPDSLAVIVDEGAGISDAWGTAMATPGVAEKGYTDVVITVRMPGGHSSIPPDHTGIGVMSELITLIEANPYTTFLDSDNPYLGKLQCGASYADDFPRKLRRLLKSSPPHEKSSKSKPDYLALEAAKAGPAIRYLMQTSVAVDTIEGGVKVNALPERVSVDVNHRINIGERPSDVHAKLAELAARVAKKYDLGLNAFNGVDEAPKSISLVAANTTLEVAPITPTDVDDITAYFVLSGTTRALYGTDLVVAPGLMTGNTDTRYYWNLTKHIFRYAPGWTPGDDKGLAGIHTVDEKVNVDSHINAARWFSLFIRNMDDANMD